MRNTAMWRKLLDVRDGDAAGEEGLRRLRRQVRARSVQADRLGLRRLPAGRRRAEGVRGDPARHSSTSSKLVECAKEQAKKDGRDVTIIDYNGKKLYTDNQKAEAWATFLDAKTVVVGGKEWVKKVVDLAAGKGESAKANAELAALLKRAKTSDALWGAGIVPQSTRDSFKNDPRLSSAASMKDIFGSVDFASGVRRTLNVDTGSEADAKDLAAKATAQLADVQEEPAVHDDGPGAVPRRHQDRQQGRHLPPDGRATTSSRSTTSSIGSRACCKSFGGAMGGGGMPMQPPPTP